MPSSGILRHVALITTDVSEELTGVLRLLITANVIPISPILVTLMMEAIRSFETSVLTRATWRHIAEDGILHSHRRENLKYYELCMICPTFVSLVRPFAVLSAVSSCLRDWTKSFLVCLYTTGIHYVSLLNVRALLVALPRFRFIARFF
jgi:hypothetical protein